VNDTSWKDTWRDDDPHSISDWYPGGPYASNGVVYDIDPVGYAESPRVPGQISRVRANFVELAKIDAADNGVGGQAASDEFRTFCAASARRVGMGWVQDGSVAGDNQFGPGQLNFITWDLLPPP